MLKSKLQSELDGRLSSLLRDLQRDSPPLDELSQVARQILVDYSHKPGSGVWPNGEQLLEDGWDEWFRDWRLRQNLEFEPFEHDATCEKTAIALHNVFDKLLKLVVGSDTPYHEKKHAGQLTEALCEYQARRGVDFSARKPVASSQSGRVMLFGRQDKPIVNGKEKNPLTVPQYNVVLALLNADDKGLTKDMLDNKSGHGDARKILKRIAKIDEDWCSVISFPGTPGKGYHIV